MGEIRRALLDVIAEARRRLREISDMAEDLEDDQVRAIVDECDDLGTRLSQLWE